MTYRYADGTPFPVKANFLETVRKIVKAAIVALEADEELTMLGRQLRAAEVAAKADASRVQEVKNAVAGALRNAANGNGSAHLVAHVLAETEKASRKAQRKLRRRHSGVRHIAKQRIPDIRASWAQQVCGTLPLDQFPEVRSSFHYALNEDTPYMGMTDNTYFGVRLSRVVNMTQWLAAGHRADIGGKIQVPVPTKGWLRNTIVNRATDLSRYWIVDVVENPDFRRIVLSKSRSNQARTVTVTVPRGPKGTLCISNDHGVTGKVDVEGKKKIEQWAELIASQFQSHARTAGGTVTQAELDGIPLNELHRPALLAERLIDALAPYVAEIRFRGGGRRDRLVVKRDIRDGLREELSLDTRPLTAAIATLPADTAAFFTPLGFVNSNDDEQSGSYETVGRRLITAAMAN